MNIVLLGIYIYSSIEYIIVVDLSACCWFLSFCDTPEEHKMKLYLYRAVVRSGNCSMRAAYWKAQLDGRWYWFHRCCQTMNLRRTWSHDCRWWILLSCFIELLWIVLQLKDTAHLVLLIVHGQHREDTRTVYNVWKWWEMLSNEEIDNTILYSSRQPEHSWLIYELSWHGSWQRGPILHEQQ